VVEEGVESGRGVVELVEEGLVIVFFFFFGFLVTIC
jgi:hypothetical protein